MTVGELITELTKYKMDDDVYVSIDDKEKIGSIVNLTRWKGMCEIHFDNWTRTIEIPEGATNGDVIKALFSDAEIIFENGFYETTVDWHTKTHRCHFFDNDWWNSPYRKEK